MLVNLNEILYDAQKRHYAVGHFNTIDGDILEATITAAEEMNSPVIIGTAEVLLRHGDLPHLAPSMVSAAKRAKVPVAVHYDHGLTFDRCLQAMSLGFSSIMFDGSASELEENYRSTREIVKVAHSLGKTVEGEIGHVGFVVDGAGKDADLYTTPKEACEFVENTGVDALAIAIGTAHGAYTAKPKLDFARLAEIRSSLDTPLVLHGGSGLSDDDFKKAIQGGITKINIYTDLCLAGEKAMKENLDKAYPYIRDAKVLEIKKTVINKMQLFGSAGKY